MIRPLAEWEASAIRCIIRPTGGCSGGGGGKYLPARHRRFTGGQTDGRKDKRKRRADRFASPNSGNPFEVGRSHLHNRSESSTSSLTARESLNCSSFSTLDSCSREARSRTGEKANRLTWSLGFAAAAVASRTSSNNNNNKIWPSKTAELTLRAPEAGKRLELGGWKRRRDSLIRRAHRH